ncbi:RNA-splicing ligase RtcB [Candidatus Bathyarchaeota archaeon]|nr:MAG: RNA-splicing ligase RtcB [Candidatus Bathyarchaeota archaeon]
MSGKVPLEKIDDYTWRIPQYKPGMRVPGMVFANRELLEKMQTDRTLGQCVNVAHLPGIYKYSITLPDGHEGYGFPIGGVAATDYEEGVISPGGVGYDINCLTGDARVLTKDGFWVKISDFKRNTHKLLCVDLKSHDVVETGILRFIKMLPKARVYRIFTESGNQITATEDHPFLTPKGMVPVKELKKGDKVAVFPFEGVEYEEPPKRMIVDENLGEIPFISEQKKKAVIRELKKRGLLPLYLNDKRIAALARIIGYVTGDGTVYFTKGKGYVWFYGKPEDLEEIRLDIKKIGYTASRIYKRARTHKTLTRYGLKKFVSVEHCFRVSASSFASLLMMLGAPVGDKTKAKFGVPSWIMNAPKWIKRLYLAALFGAELTTPKNMYRYSFYCPVLGINKSKESEKDGYRFLKQVSALLREFEVKTAKISSSSHGLRKTGEEVVRLRLIISSTPENLIKFFGRIGYVYNRKRSLIANLALHYLKLKVKVIEKRVQAVAHVETLKHEMRPAEIYRQLTSKWVNKRFIERTLHVGRKTQPRVAQEFMSFEEFLNNPNFVASEFAWDKIVKKEEVEYNGYVYDFTVNHQDHNFIANGFVVSNCGVRLVTTNLTEQDVRPKLAQLANTIFQNVPCGLGSRRKDFRVSVHDLERLVMEGVHWAIDHGLGWSEDIKHHEEQGCMKNANPDKVSTTAKNRGLTQIGTLGSGNHFLEIQKVNEIYDERAAKSFGIEHEGQVTIMIHCGSRGFGHQICSDYLRVMERAVQKYKIALPDRELACAPGNTKEAKDYYQAMACAVNYAFVNRQTIMHWVRESFKQVFREDPERFGLNLVYDVAHNIAKIETHMVNGERRKVWVHRKGATRAFPPGHPDIPADYRAVGQPVLIPGSMGTSSWLLVGTEKAMQITFGSTAHGAGRMLSRHAAKRRFWGGDVKKALEQRGIFVRAASSVVLAEEADPAYKNVDVVAEVSDKVGIATKVARFVPLAVVKG